MKAASQGMVPGSMYKAPGFNESYSKDCSLNVSLYPHQITYCLKDPSSRRVLFLQSYHHQSNNGTESPDRFLKEVFAEDAYLARSFSGITIGVSSSDFTLLPSEFSEERITRAWSKKLLSKKEDVFFHDTIEKGKLNLVYSIPQQLKALLDKFSKDYSIQHTLASLINNLQRVTFRLTVYCCVQPGVLQVLILDENRVIFMNRYFYNTPEDFVYFLLAAMKHMRLDPERINVVFYGEILRDSMLFQIVYKYIRHVDFGKTPDRVVVDESYPFPLHFYYPLFCL